jgi:hypothetical protein
MLDFPSSPSVGQQFPVTPTAGIPVYQWDGIRWMSSQNVIGATSSDDAPIVDGIAAAGIASRWSRGDHVHPTDTRYVPSNNATFTGTVTAQTFNASGNFTLGGKITAATKGQSLGTAGGLAGSGALTKDDANIVLYDYDGLENWAGLGIDGGGNLWVRTGTGTRWGAAMWAMTSGEVNFYGAVTAPSPPNGSDDDNAATTAYVAANQALGGPYFPLTGGTITGTFNVAGDLYLYGWGGNANVSVLYFGKTADRYFHYNGTSYIFGGALLYTLNGRIWGTSDWTRPVVSARVGPHGGDVYFPWDTGLTEPYAGAAQTGSTGAWAPDEEYVRFSVRFRYNQILVEGTWYTAGYV